MADKEQVPTQEERAVTISYTLYRKVLEHLSDLGQSKQGRCPFCGLRVAWVAVEHADNCILGKVITSMKEANKNVG